jgi:hypothetical protein
LTDNNLCLPRDLAQCGWTQVWRTVFKVEENGLWRRVLILHTLHLETAERKPYTSISRPFWHQEPSPKLSHAFWLNRKQTNYNIDRMCSVLNLFYVSVEVNKII